MKKIPISGIYESNQMSDALYIFNVLNCSMFVSTVKRLRVLKSSELPTLSREFFTLNVDIQLRVQRLVV